MTVAGAVSHDRERRRKSKGHEAQRLDEGKAKEEEKRKRKWWSQRSAWKAGLDHLIWPETLS